MFFVYLVIFLLIRKSQSFELFPKFITANGTAIKFSERYLPMHPALDLSR